MAKHIIRGEFVKPQPQRVTSESDPTLDSTRLDRIEAQLSRIESKSDLILQLLRRLYRHIMGADPK